MSTYQLNSIIQNNIKTKSQWQSLNPVLKLGELGLESDTLMFKVGNGSTNYNSLGYYNSNISQSCSGNSATSTKLLNPRTISLTGDITGSATFDGSNNVSIVTSDSYPTITFSKTLTIGTSWIDTGITMNQFSNSGSYIVQISGMTSSTGFWSEIFTGLMSIYVSGTNSSDSDEIVLHKSGHASTGGMLFLRTVRNLNSSSLPYNKLQICSNRSNSSSVYVFKFRRLI